MFANGWERITGLWNESHCPGFKSSISIAQESRKEKYLNEQNVKMGVTGAIIMGGVSSLFTRAKKIPNNTSPRGFSTVKVWIGDVCQFRMKSLFKQLSNLFKIVNSELIVSRFIFFLRSSPREFLSSAQEITFGNSKDEEINIQWTFISIFRTTHTESDRDSCWFPKFWPCSLSRFDLADFF